MADPGSTPPPCPPPPGGTCTPAGGPCAVCGTGMIVVTTKRLAVCWDTGPGGVGAADPLLPNVPVKVSGTGTAPPDQTTQDASGCKVTFGPVMAGEWKVEAGIVEGYEWASAEKRVRVEPGGTTQVDLRLERNGLECNRQHPAPSGTSDGPSIWLPVLWVFWGEPWALILRDVLWVAAAAFIALGAGAFDLMPDPALCAFSAALTAYLTLMIFGQVLGVIAIAAAAALWLVVIAMATIASVASFVPLPAPSPLLFSLLNGGWTAFLLALLVGRTSRYAVKMIEVATLMGLLGAAVALITLYIATSGEASTALFVGTALLGYLCGFVFGWIGHIFANEGNTLAEHWSPQPTPADWDVSSQQYLLPYAGERYCVQGVRGLISHSGWQEFAYDFAIPEGTPVLCAREGHIIAYKQDRTGTAAISGNSTANYVHVKHRDGSIAEYLHGKQGGVTSVNPDLAGASTRVTPRVPDDTYMKVTNAVYVGAGQVLCEAGNVGISMFSHIHFVVKRDAGQPANPGEASNYHPVKFADPDVQGHGGRCFTFRKYRSNNLNRGPVSVPPPVVL